MKCSTCNGTGKIEMKKYPKFKSDEDCAFPERKDCNYGEGYERCPYMKFNSAKSMFDPTRWECTFKDFKKKEPSEE